ncbi:MAG: type I methionyl aminopeptidase [Candidatus Omnitrophota bacterium]|nr:type I methionyl aminopeptidase [Candidatus Omnitrophota bacterium]
MIGLKSDRELAIMRKAGGIVAEVLNVLGRSIKPGIETIELDRQAEILIKELGGRPAFKNYKGYPANICTSINEVIVHGIPGKKVLRDGDIISVDVGAELEGYYGDAAYTYPVGNINDESKRLIEVTQKSLEKGIEAAVAGHRVSDISRAIQNFVEANGFNVIRAFIGHGIGADLHEPPEIPNFVTRECDLASRDADPVLENGMVLAIEPMVAAGKYAARILSDGWTAVTVDKSRVAHFEHTVAVRDKGTEILTLCQRKNR